MMTMGFHFKPEFNLEFKFNLNTEIKMRTTRQAEVAMAASLATLRIIPDEWQTEGTRRAMRELECNLVILRAQIQSVPSTITIPVEEFA